MNAHSPDLDSTQTVRALTNDELYDSHRPKSFAIQLVVSDRPVNLDMMPRLEAFAAHKLYAVVGKRDNVAQYALRLGFFPDELSANLVCGHLRTFFASPEIVRISAAEQARFTQPAAARATAQKPKSSSAAAVRPSVAPVQAPAPVATPSVPRQALAQKPKTTATGAHRKPRTLAEELLAEAREIQLSRSGKHRVAEQNRSWVARLFGGPKR
jgi:hypothetical protein